MLLFEVRNGLGLEFTVSADRCADLSWLTVPGRNCGFFSAIGYVHPAYYDSVGKGSEKNFTGGFSNVGAPYVDQREALPLHGAISNLPAECIFWGIDRETTVLKAVIPHGGFCAQAGVKADHPALKMRTLADTVRNVGDRESPLMLLYHIDLGCPCPPNGRSSTSPQPRCLPGILGPPRAWSTRIS